MDEYLFLEEAFIEQDMMISLYEHQRFMIEQDTQVFMGLKYDFIEEGVLDKIGSVIMTIFRKIKELIMRFINFITSIRKKDIKDIEKNEEEAVDLIDEKVKKVSATVNEVNKSFDEIEDKIKERKASDWMISRYKDIIENSKRIIDNIEKRKAYIPIYIHVDVMRKTNISDKWTDIETLLDTAEDIVSLVKERKNIDQELEKYNNFVPLSGNVRSSQNKNDSKAIYVDNNNLCDRKTYYAEYYRNAKAFFRNYTDESAKNIDYLQDIMDKRIKPLEKEVKAIMSSIDKKDSYKKTVNKLQMVINALSQSCTSRIASLIEVEKAYQAYKQNMAITIRCLHDIEDITSDANEFQEMINKLINTSRD